MTLHPCPLSSRPGPVPTEVPGLAYYAAPGIKAVRPRPEVKASAEQQALDVMYGYYTLQD